MDVVTMDFLTIIERFGVSVALVIIFSMVAARFLGYLDNRADADESRQKSWDDIRKNDNQQWAQLLTGQTVAIQGLGLTQTEFYKMVKDDRVTMMAYQNTTSTALAELLVAIKDLRTLPDTLKKVQTDLSAQLTKMQNVAIETESRHHLESTKHSANTNNAILEVQKGIVRIEKALEKLPVAMQATLSPMVTMLEQVLSSAQATQAKIDDMPLADKVVEKDLLEVIPTPSTDGIHITHTDEKVVTDG